MYHDHVTLCGGRHCGGRRCALPPAPLHPLLFFNQLPLLPTLFRFYSYVFPFVFFDPPCPQFLDDFHYDRPYLFFLILICFFWSLDFVFFWSLFVFFDPLALESSVETRAGWPHPLFQHCSHVGVFIFGGVDIFNQAKQRDIIAGRCWKPQKCGLANDLKWFDNNP